jgi:Family of unknown function (DUF5330)
MFFLLRVAFWLTIVLALLPTGSSQPVSNSVGATEAMVAAGAAVSDMTGFCGRQPDACAVGTQAAVAIGQRAQAGAKMVYEFISDQMARSETGSVPETKKLATRVVPASPDSQSTLKPSDLEPSWQGPVERTDVVPLPRPRKDPRRQA